MKSSRISKISEMVNSGKEIRDQGVSVMNVWDRITVLDNGKLMAGGTPQENAKKESVIEA